MKGLIHTDILLKALLNASAGLRQPGTRVSHVFLADIPAYPKLLAISDAAVNIAPDLSAKAAILQHAIDLMASIGVDLPKAAILSAVETVNPLISSSLDAAALSVMSLRGQVRGAVVDGPLAFDNAISLKAAEIKGIASPVAGDADILLVPDLVSGNILAKSLEYMADATLAGLVLGLNAPIVLPSRADPVDARLAGLALARLSLAAKARESAPQDKEPEKCPGVRSWRDRDQGRSGTGRTCTGSGRCRYYGPGSASRHRNEPGASGSDRCGSSCQRPRDDGQPGLRIRRTSDHNRRARRHA